MDEARPLAPFKLILGPGRSGRTLLPAEMRRLRAVVVSEFVSELAELESSSVGAAVVRVRLLRPLNEGRVRGKDALWWLVAGAAELVSCSFSSEGAAVVRPRGRDAPNRERLNVG